MRLSGLRQTTYQAKHHVSKGLTRMKSALERERVASGETEGQAYAPIRSEEGRKDL
jgi:hypothetical protein